MKRIKSLISSYPPDFWAFVILIAILSAVMLYVNNGMDIAYGRAIGRVRENADIMTRLISLSDDPAKLQATAPTFITPQAFTGNAEERCFGLFDSNRGLILGRAPGGYNNSGVREYNYKGVGWISIYVPLPDYVYVESYPASTTGASNIYIIILAVTAIGFVYLIQPNARLGTSPFRLLLDKLGERRKPSLSPIMLSIYGANLLMLAVAFIAVVANMAYQFASKGPLWVLTVLAGAIAVAVLMLRLYIGRSMSERGKTVFVVLSMFPAATMNLLVGGFAVGSLPIGYIWILPSLVFAVFLTGRHLPLLLLKLFTLTLFGSIVLELYFAPTADSIPIIEFVSNTFYIGFLVFASFDFFMNRIRNSYTELEEVYEKFKETQHQMVQNEHMITLGQLIAGVAHEINTPIGAIKASAEILEGFDLGTMLKDMQRHRQSDLETLSAILDMCVSSVKNMRSTVELRRGKTQVRKFLESLDIPAAERISTLLAGMEICDLEKIADNMDILRRDNILEILQSARAIFPYINSVQSIQFASDRVAKIVFSLKSFSHMNITGEEREFDVAQSIDNILVLYQNQLKRGIEIIKDYDDYLPKVYGNVEEVGQVWTNIAQNAIHAMSYVGKLTITIRNKNDTAVSVAFTDTGSGISSENMSKIFTPFFTTKPLGEGSGLGLDICKKIIEKHKGEITVKSEPGEGTTFTVTLPVRNQPFAIRKAGEA